MQNRNYGIELYRCLLMWGICLLHSISQGIYKLSWAENGLLFCVDGFIFITGYYGASFKWSKIIKLYGTALYTGTLVVGWGFLQGYFDGMTQIAIAKSLKRVYLDAWFLNGYIVVLFFAPMIEKVLSSRNWTKILLPLLVLVFGWSFLRSGPIGGVMPDSAGVGAYSGITLLGVYVCGRIARKCEQSFSFKHGQLVLAGVGSLLICLLGFGSYASPFAVVVAMCLFYLFKQVKQTAKREIFGKMVNLIAPSLFSVYLLHSNVIGFNLIKDVERGGGKSAILLNDRTCYMFVVRCAKKSCRILCMAAK